jgi:hypothetical protein
MTDVEPYDHSHEEVESREELDRHLARGRLSGLVVQGLTLDDDPPVRRRRRSRPT